MAGVVTDEIEQVVVQIPADTGYLSLCRVNASAVGAMLDFDVDALDDLRLAVTEAVTWCLEGALTGSRMELAVSGSAGVLHFSVSGDAAPGASEEMDDLSSAILGAMVDESASSISGGRLSLTFTKSASSG